MRCSGHGPCARSAARWSGVDVTLVARPVILRVREVVFAHHPVAMLLGDDRGGRDRRLACVAADDRPRLPAPALGAAMRGEVAVDQRLGAVDAKRLAQAVHCQGHRQHRRAEDVEPVDVLDLDHADAEGAAAADAFVGDGPPIGRELLRIVDPDRTRLAQHHRGCDNRSRQRSAPGFVDAGDQHVGGPAGAEIRRWRSGEHVHENPDLRPIALCPRDRKLRQRAAWG